MSYALSFSNPRFTSDIFDAVERNFSNFLDRRGERPALPRVDVRETADAYLLDMELPGRSESDVDVSFKDQVLSITAEPKAQAASDGKDECKWLIKERVASSFARHFTLPNDVDPSNINAEFASGVLTVNIPRRPETKRAKIAITAK